MSDSFETAPGHRDPAPPGRPVVRRGLAVGARIVVIVVLLVASLAVFGLLVATREHSPERTEAAPPVLVRTVPAEPRPVERVWEGFGAVRSMARATVAAEVSGRVVERPAGAEPGLSVERGALLLAIDPTDYEAAAARADQAIRATLARLEGLWVEEERLDGQIRVAEEEVAAAERDLERTRQAVERGAGSQGEVDAKLTAMLRSVRELHGLRQQAELIPSRRAALEADLAGQRAEARAANENVRRTRVVSPIDGEIQSVGPRPGDYVSAGAAVATVVDLRRVEVPLRLPAGSASWVRRVVGVDGAVRLWNGAAVGPAQHVGRVTRFSPEADPASRTITVFVEVEQDPSRADRLLPGAFVHGLVSTPDTVERVVIPRRALRSGRVLVAVEGDDGLRVRAEPVETAYTLEASIPDLDPAETEWAVLAEGATLPAGARVVVSGLSQLVPGARVAVEGGDEP